MNFQLSLQNIRLENRTFRNKSIFAPQPFDLKIFTFLNQLTPDIVIALKSGSKQAYEHVFHTLYNPLLNLATGIVGEEGSAEEIVQELFIKLWEKKEQLADDTRLFPYMLTSVRNRCYNYLRDRKVEDKYKQYQLQQYREEIMDYDLSNEDEALITRLHEAINEMPEKCQEVFKLSRFEGLSHKEIADKLDISTKTIENHITRAMKMLKSKFLVILYFILNSLGDL